MKLPESSRSFDLSSKTWHGFADERAFTQYLQDGELYWHAS
jgi:hypothetical protein